MGIKNFINIGKLPLSNKDTRRKVMSNFEIKDNQITIKGLTEKGEAIYIELNIEDIVKARNEYIKNNKEYVKKSMAEVFKMLFS